MKVPNNGNLTAIVTGASSGIGVRYAIELAGEGNNLILVSNQAEEVKNVALKISKDYNLQYRELTEQSDCVEKGFDCSEGSSSKWVSALYKDLARPESAYELFELCMSRKIEVDILINNAGIFFFRDVMECSPEKVSTILTLHIYTVSMLCRLFGAEMAKRKRGYILNMSSLSAHMTFPGISLYAATKSYIRTMSIAMRLELKEYNVNVLTVSPGAVATDLYSLPKNLQRLGIRLGIIYRPERLARKAMKKLYAGKKEFVPGSINRLFKPLCKILPQPFILWARKKTAKFRK